MKKSKLLILVLILFMIPFVVMAEECSNSSIKLKSVTIENKSDSVTELEELSFDENTINLHLKMKEVEDSIKYKIVLDNESEEDFFVDRSSINIDSDYIDYTVETEDESNVVHKGETKTVYLTVEYQNEVPTASFENGVYNDNQTVLVNLSNSDVIEVPDTFKEFSGKKIIAIVIVAVLALSLSLILYNNPFENRKKTMILIIGLSIVIPTAVNAVCKEEIKIVSKVEIVNPDTHPCTFNGELVQGATYINGDYTYRYKMAKDENGWHNIDEDGWGVSLTY